MKKLLFVGLMLAGIYACKPKEQFPELIPFDLNWPGHFPPAAIPSDNPLTLQGVELGKKLFNDPMLSADGTQSCASCHDRAFAFTDHGRDFSIGVLKMKGKRNAMAIFNLALHNNGFFWDGRAKTLHEQSLMPIQDHLEMNETMANVINKLQSDPVYPQLFKNAFRTGISEETIGKALEQYMLSLVSAGSKFDRVILKQDTFTPSEQRGFELFNTEFNPSAPKKGADCFHCHGGPNFTNNAYLNNGLDATFVDSGYAKTTGRNSDIGKFKVTSLRNISASGPYMHDGRFKTLEQVIEHYNSGIVSSPTLDPNMSTIQQGLNLTAQEKADLKAFLLTLTDSTFLRK